MQYQFKMKANIFAFKHFAIHDGPGIRTTIFFKGCPLSCLWCHNPEGQNYKSELQFYPQKCIGCNECINVCKTGSHIIDRTNGMMRHLFIRETCNACGNCINNCLGEALKLCGKYYTIEQVIEEVIQDISFYLESGGGITLSGGECLCQADFCSELLQKIKSLGINTAVDTSGYVARGEIDKVIPFTDIFLYDIKHIDPESHRAITGVRNDIIIENLLYLCELHKKVEIRIPIIPSLNDNDQTIYQIGTLLKNHSNIQGVRLLKYNNLASSKYDAIGKMNTLPRIKPPSDAKMMHLKRILEDSGLNVFI